MSIYDIDLKKNEKISPDLSIDLNMIYKFDSGQKLKWKSIQICFKILIESTKYERLMFVTRLIFENCK